MSFMNAMKNEMLEDFNDSVTENGAVGYCTTGKNLLDINFAVASLRSADEQDIISRFQKAFFEDKVLAIKWLFFARDVRGGLGERRLFRTAMKFVAEYEPDMAIRLIPLIPEYGRFDDLWEFLDDEKLRPVVVECVQKQLQSDIENCRNNKPVSLIAKWMPSANASSERSKKYSRILRNSLEMRERDYRQTLSMLRRHIDVVEVKMSAKLWGDINYEAVPSRANLIYNDAFLRNDEERRREFLSKLEKGDAKINASVLYPHDIVHKYMKSGDWYSRLSVSGYDAAIEAMWKALLYTVQGCGNTIVVADGSGSMTVNIGGGSGVTALEVANSLAIYFAEHSSSEFKDKYITFSESPQFVDFSKATSLRDKISIALQHSEVANTNIEAVFDLILNTAINNHMSQSDIPESILIVSDMEFDGCAVSNTYGRYGRREERVNAKLFKVIEQRYSKAGYKLPRLVFWNVNSRTNTIPVRENDMGVALVSGFSVNICKMVMSGKTDPFECLLEAINSERYQPIEAVLKG